ncbi:glycosyltransferase family 2 protein [Thalassotalea piscium]
MKYCFLIPLYNHSEVIRDVIIELTTFEMPIIVVNDGSESSVAKYLDTLTSLTPLLTVLHHDKNKGKGAAVQTGFIHADVQGYDYAIQIDADGQHSLNDIKHLLKMSAQFPGALISGNPIYDESVPKHRYWARYITHVWVYIETLSLSLIDTMCGFRVYPIKDCVALIKEVHLGERMDFDTEIMVRLYWRGVNIKFFPTKVIYPENGVSHFNAFEDNVLISWMHTKLFFGMLIRSPILLARKFIHQKHK